MDCGIEGIVGKAGPPPLRCVLCKRKFATAKIMDRYREDPEYRAVQQQRHTEWKALNPERQKERQKEYDRLRIRDPLEKSASDRQSYLKHRESRLVKMRAYRQEHLQEGRAKSRAYFWSHREKQREYRRGHYLVKKSEYVSRAAERRLRKRNATVERVERETVWQRDRGICHICEKPADKNRWDLEHIVPLVLGGAHSYANVAVSHPRCNRTKFMRVGNVQLGLSIEGVRSVVKGGL